MQDFSTSADYRKDYEKIPVIQAGIRAGGVEPPHTTDGRLCTTILIRSALCNVYVACAYLCHRVVSDYSFGRKI